MGRCRSDWAALARPGQTIVIYMGVAAIGIICEQLMAHGLDQATPAAAVCDASVGSQRTVVGTLADLAARVVRAEMRRRRSCSSVTWSH